MNRSMKSFLLAATMTVLAAMLVLTGDRCAYAEEKSDLERFGDYMQLVLPAAAYTGTLIMQDWDGAVQYTKSGVTTLASIHVMKEYFGKLRPNSGSRSSFPSGHTAAAFSGAAFLQTRYGPAPGIPAYALALVTAYSRVDADKHFIDDTVAGASVALFSNWAFVTPYQSKVSVQPMVLEDGYGLKVNIAEGSGPKSKNKTTKEFRPRYRYELQFGPAYLRKNKITAPSDTGTTFDLNNFNKIDDPTTTAALLYTFFLGKRHGVTVVFAPFESRDETTLANNVNFQGNTFTAGTDVGTSYRMYDMRLQYAYDLHPEKPWIIDVGGALAVQYTSFEMAASAGTPADAVTHWNALPLLYAKVGYYLSKRFHIDLDSSGMYLSDTRHYDGGLMLSYDIDDHWDAGVGYRYFDRRLDTSELKNDVQYDITVLKLAYQW